jgi:bifunctional UDP-N-acetylglucosamine pyrophosphorylase / glucosamine-1-phosphate N-acetyltransferase
MDLKPRGYDKIVQLIDKGVAVPNPLSLDVGDDVDIGRISGQGVVLYPGCRIYGSKTVISAGSRLGAEGPVTIDNCRLGPKVELKGGYFKQSVFLEKANMGLGAQVREGCLVEEEANGAHCVGLKQTILFPFVTLGSLVNFCDCLMAGGTSRGDHSEVGSSYIHFNYTPDGDKATASLFGDVPRGVMLNQPPIFLGGQGGAVGPIRLGYGTVVAAGSVLRDDILEDGTLVIVGARREAKRRVRPHTYGNLIRVVRNNVVYLANLVALEHWYRKVREPFFAHQEMGGLIYVGALGVLSQAKEERMKRLAVMAEKVAVFNSDGRELREHMAEICTLFGRDSAELGGEEFLAALQQTGGYTPGDYIQTIQSLTPGLSAQGVQWLQDIVDVLCGKAAALFRSMDLLGGKR